MPDNRVVIVHLRRPTAVPDEMRSDPFWEFGSFGITKCHDKNLMNPKNAGKLRGVRLAFAQGGRDGTRLVHLTPPVKIVEHGDRIEALWSPHQMPFRYRNAPVLVSNRAPSQFPKLAASIDNIRRGTAEGRFSSKYRSSGSPIPDELAQEVIRIYEKKRAQAHRSEIARSYDEALPWPPPQADRHRQYTYDQKLDEAGERAAARGAGSRGCKNGRRRPR